MKLLDDLYYMLLTNAHNKSSKVYVPGVDCSFSAISNHIAGFFSLSLYESIRLSHNNGRAATSAKMLRSNSLFEDIFTADLRIVRSNRAGLLLSVGALTDNLIGRNVKMLASKARNIV